MSTNAVRNNTENSAPVFEFVQSVSKVTAGTILSMTMLASSVVAGGLVGLAISFRNLPDVRILQTYSPTETTHIYDITAAPSQHPRRS